MKDQSYPTVKYGIATVNKWGEYSGNISGVEFDVCEDAVQYILENKDKDEDWYVDVIRLSPTSEGQS